MTSPTPRPVGTLLIRADADAHVGTGHVMRCLALAHAWRDAGGDAVVVGRCDSATLQQHVTDSGAAFVPLAASHPDASDLRATLREVDRTAPSWIVLDGYAFDPAYQQAVRAAGRRMLVIDDVAHWDEYHADVLLNQNTGASDYLYSGPLGERLLGTRFALLRPEFFAWRGWKRPMAPQGTRVLVTCGGSDPSGAAFTVVDALAELRCDAVAVTIVIGAHNDRADELTRHIGGLDSRVWLRVLRHTTNIAEWMAWADVAISAAGATSWELAFMGTPALLIIAAENQRAAAEALSRNGVGLCLGDARHITPSQVATAVTTLLGDAPARARMAERGRQLVDGCGAARVVDRLRALSEYHP